MKFRRHRNPDEPGFTISTIRARGAITGQNVQYVLGFSLAAIVIAFIAVYYFHFR